MTTKIEWVARPGTTPESWNPVTGCTKVSPGCKHCYAERMARRLAGRHGYPEAPNHFDVTLHPDRLEQPLRWRKPRTVFVCSMSDLFHEDVPEEWIDRIFSVIDEARTHTYLILTKRAERMYEYTHNEAYIDWQWPHVWLGVTAENQAMADERIPLLLETPAAVRFVSLEPLLEQIYLKPQWLYYNCATPGMKDWDGLDWVIVGGESGTGARPMRPDWARNLRDQCQEAGTAFFFKQWGTADPGPGCRANAKAAGWDMFSRGCGHLLDGQEWREWPK